MKREKVPSQTELARVSPTARCLAASIGTIPFVFGIFLIVVVGLEDVLGLTGPGEAYACTAVAMVALWMFIWRKTVVWSRRAIRLTMATGLICLVIPIAICFYLGSSLGRGGLLFVVGYSLPVIGWGVWMGATIRIWPLRQTGELREDRSPRCLKCGYLLIGLRATRCPECGDEPTLDELWRVSLGGEV